MSRPDGHLHEWGERGGGGDYWWQCRLCGAMRDDPPPPEDPRPAAPAAEADLRAALKEWLTRTDHDWTGVSWDDPYGARTDDLLALPALQRLVEQAAEAARLREVVARVRSMRDVAQGGVTTTAALDWALDGEGT